MGGFLLKEFDLLNGIDIYNGQAGIRPGQMPVDFAICQACFGTQIHSTFPTQIEDTLNAGKEAGAYIFITGQEGEIDAFLSAVRPYLGRVILALDWEADDNGAWGNLDYLASCAKQIQRETGVNPLIYTMASAYASVKPVADSLNCGLWIAQYASDNPTGFQSAPWNEGAYQMAMFQYSSTGRIAGWGGDLDLDLFYGDRDTWQAYAKPASASSAAPAPSAPGEVAVPASDVDTQKNTLPAGEKVVFYNTANNGLYLNSHNGGLEMGSEPMPFLVQRNDDDSVSLADPWGNWITVPEPVENGNLPSVVKGNGSKAQRWVASPYFDGIQLTTLIDEDMNLDLPSDDDREGARVQVWSKWPSGKKCPNQTWKWFTGIQDTVLKANAATLPAGEKITLTNAASADFYLISHDGGLEMSKSPMPWFIQRNEDFSISLADPWGDWITLPDNAVNGSLPKVLKGNGSKAQRWMAAPMNGGIKLVSCQDPALSIDLPLDNDHEGAKVQLWAGWVCNNQTWKAAPYAAPTAPAAAPSLAFTPDEIKAFSLKTITPGGYWIRDLESNKYLSTEDGRSITLSSAPFVWTVKTNADLSLSFASPRGNWITFNGKRFFMASGDVTKEQEFVFDGSEALIRPATNKEAALCEGMRFALVSYLPAVPLRVKEARKMAITAEGSDIPLSIPGAGEGCEWIVEPDDVFEFKLLTPDGQALTSDFPYTRGLTVTDAKTASHPLWIMHANNVISPENAPYMAIEANKDGCRLLYIDDLDSASHWAFKPIAPQLRKMGNEKSDDKEDKVSEDEKTAAAASAPSLSHKVDDFLEGKLVGDVAETIESDIKGGAVDEDAEAVADKMSSMIEEALGKKKLSRKTLRWVFVVAIVIALACIVLAAISLAGPLPKWVAGLCALIVGSTGIGGHSLGIAASTK